MIEATCVQKFRDNSQRIIGYRLMDHNEQVCDIKADNLKRAMKRGEINVNNLLLTSDNRIISINPEEEKKYIGYTKHTIEDIRESGKQNPLYKRYEKIFSSIDVDVVGAIYLAFPDREKSLTETILRSMKIYYNSIRVGFNWENQFVEAVKLKYGIDRRKDDASRKAFRNLIGGRGLEADEVRFMIQDKDIFVSTLVGSLFPDLTYDVFSYEGKMKALEYADMPLDGICYIGAETRARAPLLVLHKDGKFKVIAAMEMKYASAARIGLGQVRQELEDTIKKQRRNEEEKDNAFNWSLAIMTIGADKRPKITKVGSHISKRESQLLARRMLESDFDNWLGTEAIHNMYYNVSKEVYVNFAKSLPLTAPLAILLAAASIGAGIFGAAIENQPLGF